MTDYSKSAERADKSLRRKGTVVILRRPAKGDYDPEIGGIPNGGQDTDYSGTGVKFDYDAQLIDGTTIVRGDQQMLLSPLQRDGSPMPKPSVSDLIVIGTQKYAIRNVAELSPTDTSILYTLQLRGM